MRRIGLWAGLLLGLAACGPRPAPPPGVSLRADRYFSDKDGMELVPVPEGSFLMGSAQGSYDEAPPHKVRLGAFLIDRLEVSNAQFQRFIKEAAYSPEGPWQRGAGPGSEELPVRFVTWHDAAAYAAWAGRALPTEAQWEFAARGTDGRTYPWGNEWKEGMARTAPRADETKEGLAHVDSDVLAGPARVGSLPQGASPYGALDMAGNVWEWVADWYDRYYYEALAARGVARDPKGPEDGAPPEERFARTGTAAGNERSTRKVIRGGGWMEPGQENMRSSKRMWGDPRHWFNDTGFRCALAWGR
ncbi:MAG: formylglycine-generating enzyme family protein [Elusimicrobia bacterium]|nr:formylglycine-generating enzyme family protein [Elusimicrobiota bacterium]